MKAKSIKGKTPEEIKSALQQSMADTSPAYRAGRLPDGQGFKPTLAFVFLTDVEDIDTVTAVLDAESITIFSASTSQKFSENGIEPEGIVVLLVDLNPANFSIDIKVFKATGSVYEAACQVGDAGKTRFEHPAFIISTADIQTPGEEVIKGLLNKAGMDVTVIGGVAGKPMMRPIILWNQENKSVLLGAHVKEDAMFRFSLPPDLEVIDTVINSTKTIKETELPDADVLLIFSCVDRLSSLGPMSSSEIEGLAAN